MQVVPVLWGSGVAADVVSGAECFYKAIVDSPYLDWLGEYDTVGLNGAADNNPGSNQRIHRGTALPTVSLVPKNTSKTIADSDIQAELLAKLAAGKLPAPHVDAEGGVDTVYMISFPPGVKVSDFSGQDVCSGGCAYHWTVTVPGVTAGVPYGVIPDCGTGAQNYCALGNGVFDTFTGDASHELVEAITDPECGLDSGTAVARPIAWFDPAQANQEGELADICLSDPSAFVSYLGFTVQANWSQRLGKCITNDPSLTLCDGNKRPCRPCGASDCSGATPICDATSGACVASVPGGGGSPDGGPGDPGGGDPGTGGSSGNSSGGSSGASSGNNANGGTNDNASSSPRSGGCMLAREGDPWGSAVCVGLVAGAAGVARRRRRRAR